MERDDSGENDQELWNDVDHAEQRIVGAEEHPVNRRDLGTPPESIKSDTYRADRRRNPAPINTLASSELIRGTSASASASIAWTVFIQFFVLLGHARVQLHSSAKRITSTKANIDVENAMVKEIARTFRWRRLRENGTHAPKSLVAHWFTFRDFRRLNRF